MEQNNTSPENDPFNYLWMANVVLYAVIVAFLLMKGWKKQRNDIPKTISEIENVCTKRKLRVLYGVYL